jgi:hypothetical protein
MSGEPIALWLRTLGVMAYAACVGLAILWLGIGLAYWRAGYGRLTWFAFVVSMAGFAVLFVGLTLVSSEPPWLDRVTFSLLQRSVAIVAAAAGWLYSMLVLRHEWRKDR